MQYLFEALFRAMTFLFGAAVGSFLLVIADRYNTGMSFWKGRSMCFSCGHELHSKDLFPIFSFLFLRGRCRYCQTKISKSAFIIELIMGTLALLASFKSGVLSSELGTWSLKSGASFIILLAIFSIILLISIYDLKHFIIPDSFLVSLFIFSFLHNSSFIINDSSSLFSWLLATGYWLLSGLVLTLPFLLLFVISRGRWLGFGDVKYIAVLGFFLGLVIGLSAITLSFWAGAAFALLALSAKSVKTQKNLPKFFSSLTIKSEIPFGPFLSLGAILAFCLNIDLFNIHLLFDVF